MSIMDQWTKSFTNMVKGTYFYITDTNMSELLAMVVLLVLEATTKMMF